MKAVIFVNGEIKDYDFVEGIVSSYDFIIACDGGLRHCHKLNIIPDCIIGDMDSATAEILEKYKDVPRIKFPPEKDFTDLELAIEHVKEAGASHLEILGGFGGRLDHQIANIYVLVQAKLPVVMRDETTRLIVMEDFCILNRSDGDLVTLLPLTSSVDGIVTEGLKYPLNEESLQMGFARGVSNEMTGEIASITLKSGLLLVIQTKQ